MVIFLAATLALGNGCALFVIGGATAAGVGGYAYVHGESKDIEAVSYDRAFDATIAGLSDLHYAIIEKNKDVDKAEIIARDPSDTKIQVTLDKESATVTEIHIRVGTFGDEEQSQLILEKIKSHF